MPFFAFEHLFSHVDHDPSSFHATENNIHDQHHATSFASAPSNLVHADHMCQSQACRETVAAAQGAIFAESDTDAAGNVISWTKDPNRYLVDPENKVWIGEQVDRLHSLKCVDTTSAGLKCIRLFCAKDLGQLDDADPSKLLRVVDYLRTAQVNNGNNPADGQLLTMVDPRVYNDQPPGDPIFHPDFIKNHPLQARWMRYPTLWAQDPLKNTPLGTKVWRAQHVACDENVENPSDVGRERYERTEGLKPENHLEERLEMDETVFTELKEDIANKQSFAKEEAVWGPGKGKLFVVTEDGTPVFDVPATVAQIPDDQKVDWFGGRLVDLASHLPLSCQAQLFPRGAAML